MYMMKAIIEDQIGGNTNPQRGAGLAEYAMLLLLITIVTAAVVSTLGNRISTIFTDTTEQLESTTPAGG